jgi:hypothetical protein
MDPGGYLPCGQEARTAEALLVDLSHSADRAAGVVVIESRGLLHARLSPGDNDGASRGH